MATLLSILKAAAVLTGSIVLVGTAVVFAMAWMLNHPPTD
jgi:hypothetical protein